MDFGSYAQIWILRGNEAGSILASTNPTQEERVWASVLARSNPSFIAVKGVFISCYGQFWPL